ncbi:hypothetical protein T02_8664 [Trichinella nativa]|uniref:PH domain-containing protein n=1 Tax=Trichinella nativa TaxID=6335 RepID=A0A0V1LHH8_9BILA|nr:hypothetical protein T02_8664 [Trichinella nativa]
MALAGGEWIENYLFHMRELKCEKKDIFILRSENEKDQRREKWKNIIMMATWVNDDCVARQGRPYLLTAVTKPAGRLLRFNGPTLVKVHRHPLGKESIKS